ncbi:MAG: alpha/beta hydrolase [Proteobacteria bacterium]|nr:alpha/beta hydrolase [Pseudomonadota bacterium]
MKLLARCIVLLALLCAGAGSASAASAMHLGYGADPAQRLEVYLPAQPRGAPILVMVHGGAWRFGRPDAASVVDNKVAHWVRERGFVFVSVGYRLVPQVDVRVQAQDVASALAEVQKLAPGWGADASSLVLMGHSAGAHLVALLSASPAIATNQGARSWAGTVVLDSAALDTVGLMQARHPRLYDQAFGADPALWRDVSPSAQLRPGSVPMLLVCSSERRDDSCGQSQRFATLVRTAGGHADVLPQALTHMEVNAQLGLPSDYTAVVDRFIDKALAGR